MMTDAIADSELARVEAATMDDLPALTDLLTLLFQEASDFKPDRRKQEHGLRLILEQPSRGRIFVVRNGHHVIGMANVLFTISTAEGGFVILLEDVVVHPDHRRNGIGSRLMAHVIEFAQAKEFRRITLLTDRVSDVAQAFYQKLGFRQSNMVPMRLILDQ